MTLRAAAADEVAPSASSAIFGCARTGGFARSASGRELQAEAPTEAATEAATEAETPHARRPRDRDSARGARGHGSRRCRLLRLELRPGRATAGAPGRQLARLRRERQPDRRPARRREPDGRRAGRDQPVDAEGDRRDRGSALLPARRRRPGRDPARARRGRERRPHRPGRLDDHAGARAQPLPLARQDAAAEGRRGLPLDQARARLVEGQDPHRVPQRRLLRQPRVRRRGCGRDVLLRSGEPADARAGRAARRAAAGAVVLRPAPQPRRRARPPRRGPARVATERGHHRRAVRLGGARPESPPAPEPGVCEPGAVLRRLRREPPAAGVRRDDRSRGRAEDLHDDPAAPAARRRARPVGGAARTSRPGRRDRLDRSRDRRDPRDGGRDARNAWQRVQPRDDGAAASRARRSSRSSSRPRSRKG